MEFPKNKFGLQNGTLLSPKEAMPWFGLKAGQMFPIFFDGTYVVAGGLSWSVEQLVSEIEAGYWNEPANTVST